MGLLNDLGYEDVRPYAAGIAGWRAHGLPLERSGAGPSDESQHAASTPASSSLGSARTRGVVSRLIDAIDQLSSRWLFLGFFLLCLASGVLFWLAGHWEGNGLRGPDGPLGTSLAELPSAIYYSFVTATTLGYGDLAPMGISRVLGVIEAAAGLLVFGALVSKFVSRRQEKLVEEMHRITWEERLGRVQVDLHIVLVDLQSITQLCQQTPAGTLNLGMRLESATMVFLSQLRTVHRLLWRPERDIEEDVLEAILAALVAALEELTRVLACTPPPPSESRADPAILRLRRIDGLASEICVDCVPRALPPELAHCVDRAVELSGALEATAMSSGTTDSAKAE